MKIFFDTEFTGLHKDTTLISIGMVSENNKQFYAELTDYNEKQCGNWIQENVLKHLYTRYPSDVEKAPYIPNLHIGNKHDIGKALEIWLKQFDTVEFVSDVNHYDFVLLIDIFGNAQYLPKNMCPACYDINQDIAKKYNITLKEAFDMSREDILYKHYKENIVKGNRHNSLYDAKVIRELYQILNNVDFNNMK